VNHTKPRPATDFFNSLLEQQSLAPLRALKDPRDAAAVLMVAVAEARGVMTPEQETLVQERMASVLGFANAEIGARSSMPATRRGRRPRSTPLSRT
jgi:hypothetical protein